MDSRFAKGAKDPIRNPLVQKRIEGVFKSNYDATLKVISARLVKILKKDAK